jgi:hypothetical protein
MCNTLRWSVLSLFVTLMAAPLASAAGTPAAPGESPETTVRSPRGLITADPAPAQAVAERSLTTLQPVQLARVPSYSVTTPTLLATGAQPIQFQGRGMQNRHVRWALTGAAIGLIVGLLDEDPVENALLGAGIGFGLSFVIGR